MADFALATAPGTSTAASAGLANNPAGALALIAAVGLAVAIGAGVVAEAIALKTTPKSSTHGALHVSNLQSPTQA